MVERSILELGPQGLLLGSHRPAFLPKSYSWVAVKQVYVGALVRLRSEFRGPQVHAKSLEERARFCFVRAQDSYVSNEVQSSEHLEMEMASHPRKFPAGSCSNFLITGESLGEVVPSICTPRKLNNGVWSHFQHTGHIVLGPYLTRKSMQHTLQHVTTSVHQPKVPGS